jgi:predicted nuclease of predicted toxin-antitoxin system
MIIRAAGAAILTKDRDFPDLVQRHGSPPFIIWITCGNTSNRALIRILRGSIRTACELIESGESIVEIGE